MKPIRVQIKRARGWRMPDNTVWVARPGRWGNPFKVTSKLTAAQAVERFRCEMPAFTREAARQQLAGKNLACFCKLTEPCHADVLLEIANAEVWP
jgi:hypothetical protein